MARAELYAFDGRGTIKLRQLLEYRFEYGMGLPCDAYEFSALYSQDMAGILTYVNRMKAFDEKGTLIFHGVVDEYTFSADEKGLLLKICGRSLAALLLDTEVPAVEYQLATLEDILRDYVRPVGIGDIDAQAMEPISSFSVASGSSRWQALYDFVHFGAGITPRFSREGRLILRSAGSGRTLALNDAAVFTALQYTDKRYGVVSEVTVINRVKNSRETVYNEAFIARGGSAGRVLNVSGLTSAKTMAYTGAYQIEQSERLARRLELALPGTADILPGDRVTLSLAKFGISGSFTVDNVTSLAGADKSETRCVLAPEE